MYHLHLQLDLGLKPTSSNSTLIPSFCTLGTSRSGSCERTSAEGVRISITLPLTLMVSLSFAYSYLANLNILTTLLLPYRSTDSTERRSPKYHPICTKRTRPAKLNVCNSLSLKFDSRSPALGRTSYFLEKCGEFRGGCGWNMPGCWWDVRLVCQL
jgi:hypothetical protein